MEPALISTINSYHAHVYYEDAAERGAAELLRTQIGERFAVQLGRWHDRPIGPHACAMYQVAFGTEIFARLVPWLMLNRCGLTLLIHPNTGNPRADHLLHACWMGKILPIMHPERLPTSSSHEEEEAIVPNSSPSLPA